jgi:Protein of unknown function (DUF2555)
MSTKQTKNEAQEVDVSKLTSEDVAQLAKRLEEDEYANAFESLQDWHILRTLAFSNPDLIEPYRHLLDIEAFDEC